MKKSFILAVALVFLLSCDDPQEGGDAPPREIMLNAPEALADCRAFHVFSATPGYPSMIIVRCPNSTATATTSSGVVTVSEDPEQ